MKILITYLISVSLFCSSLLYASDEVQTISGSISVDDLNKAISGLEDSEILGKFNGLSPDKKSEVIEIASKIEISEDGKLIKLPSGEEGSNWIQVLGNARKNNSESIGEIINHALSSMKNEHL
ncbi:hypothetical protein OAB57_01910, partial [Bacteriovoracaceae bacterium]|nr:hypothetical protein [Bacteriovoracaceae bacterium]